MALLSAQSLQKQGHKVIFYTFEHDPDCFPELQEGLTIVTGKTTKKMQNWTTTQNAKETVHSEGSEKAQMTHEQ